MPHLLCLLLRVWRFPLWVLVAIIAVIPGTAQAECGHQQLSVIGTQDEVALTCKALVIVSDYFKGLGEPDVPTLVVRFEESVQFPGDSNLNLAGLFQGEQGTIDVVRPSSTHAGRVLHWNQPWSQELARSILEHELAHAFAYSIGGKQLDYVWNEFVAYAVQFDVMEPELKARIFASYPNATPYEKTAMVCDLAYLVDIDSFAVRSYLTAEARGGRNFVGDVLSGAYPTKAPRRFECPAADP